jgi:hypothetical protein
MPPPDLSLRQPAPSEFLARRVARILWLTPATPRALLVETCRAELEWAVAEWRSIAGDPDIRRGDSHPAERWRLPHEHAAARVVNCHLHVDVFESLLRACHARRRAGIGPQRCKEESETASGYRARRGQAWRCYLEAAADYRAVRLPMSQGPLSGAA